jgi:6-phosphogluconolactonase
VGSPFPSELIGFSVAVDPSGKFVYVANASPTDSISAFTVDPNTGALSRVVGSPVSTPGCDASITVDPSAKFVGSVWIFQLEPSSHSTAHPSLVAGTPVQ